METTIVVYWGYIGIMEKKMEAAIIMVYRRLRVFTFGACGVINKAEVGILRNTSAPAISTHSG